MRVAMFLATTVRLLPLFSLLHFPVLGGSSCEGAETCWDEDIALVQHVPRTESLVVARQNRSQETHELRANEWIIGDGTTGSCTFSALYQAWEEVSGGSKSPGSTIEFRCGPPCTEVVIPFTVRLMMNRGAVTLKADTSQYARVVFDGLGVRRLLVFGTLNYVTSHKRVILSGSASTKEIKIEGISFRNGRGDSGEVSLGDEFDGTDDWGTVGGGACVAVGYGAHLEIKDAEFTNCTSSGAGGAIMAEAVGMVVEDSLFEGNSASSGGGFWLNQIPDAGADFNPGLRVERSVFRSNTASSQGAGFRFATSAVTEDYETVMYNVTLEDNIVTDFPVAGVDRTLNGGGGALIKLDSTGTLRMEDVVAKRNAGGCGGAFVIYCHEAQLHRVAIHDNVAYGNTYSDGSTMAVTGGGAFFLSGGPMTVTYSNFLRNTAKLGGAIAGQNAGLHIYDSAFVDNAATSHMDFSDISPDAVYDNRPSRQWEDGGHGGAIWMEQWGATGTQDDPAGAEVHSYVSSRVIFQGNNADNTGGAVCGGLYDHGSTKALRHTVLFSDSAFCVNFMADHPSGLGSGAVSKMTGGKHSFDNCVFGGNVAGNGTDTKDAEHEVAHCCCIGHESGGHCYDCYSCSAEEEQYENSSVPGTGDLPVYSTPCDGYSVVTSTPPSDFAPHDGTVSLGGCESSAEESETVEEAHMEFLDVPDMTRCTGAPLSIGGTKWNNLGTQSDVGFCSIACLAASVCNFAVYNVANGACSAFDECSTFQTESKVFTVLQKVTS